MAGALKPALADCDDSLKLRPDDPDTLDSRGFIADRDTSAPDSFLDSISPLGWLRRAMAVNQDRR